MSASVNAPARAGQSGGTRLALVAAAGLSLLWAAFVWAVGRGFDPTDEAVYLTLIHDPSRYLAASDFAEIWRPLNALVGGDIVRLRLAGAVVLQACALLFGFSVVRFCGLARQPGPRALGVGLALALAAGFIWPFGYWKVTPNYNTAALCGLLLTFSGLMTATASAKAVAEARPATVSALLTGLGLALCAFAKPTTAVAALGLCLLWLLLLKPRRPIYSITVSALTCLLTMALSIWLMGDGFEVYFSNKLLVLHHLSGLQADSGLNGRLATALVRPLARENWGKIAAIAPFLAGLLVLATGWCWPAIAGVAGGRARAMSYACAALLGLCAFWWRAGDVWSTDRTPGYLAWCFVTLAPLVVSTGCYLARARPVRGPARGPAARNLAAAALLGAAPLAYSFGTDVMIPFHAAGAAIFWPAALAVLIGEGSPLKTEILRPSLVVLSLACALGLMAGVVVTPGPAGPHLWLQTTATSIGPSGAVVALDPETSAYYRALRSTAGASGFQPGTMVADLAGLNDGMIYAIGGRPAATAVVPGAVAARPEPPWVLASPSPGKFAAPADLAGARFPQDYMLVAQAVHRSKGWTEQLWKPKNRQGEP